MRVRLVLIASLLILTLAAPALAARVVRDDRRETAELAANGRADIVKATGSRSGSRLKHVVVMRKRVQPRRTGERPLIAINTSGGGASGPEFVVRGSAVVRLVDGGSEKVGKARLRSKRRRWVFSFKTGALGGTGAYGWAVLTSADGAVDVAPPERYARQQLSPGSAAPAG